MGRGLFSKGRSLSYDPVFDSDIMVNKNVSRVLLNKYDNALTGQQSDLHRLAALLQVRDPHRQTEIL